MHSRVAITGDINSSQTGTYEIIYSVVDIAGNVSESVKRTVVISDEVSENPPTYWWSSATTIGNGFYQNWLGQFMPFSSGWIYHLDFGWVYVVKSDIQGLWLWIENEGWVWTSENVWFFLWSNKTEDWLYFKTLNNEKYFFDYFTSKFREIQRWPF